jgi:hypothetical protein
MARQFINQLFIDEVLRRYPDEDTKIIAADLGITLSKIYNIANKYKVKKSQAYLNNWKLSGRGKMIEAGKAHRFTKGHKSFNTGISSKVYMKPESYAKCVHTQFKKGGLPANTKHDGAISLRHDKSGASYYYIRIAKAKWVLYHNKIWSDAYGPIPKKHIIVFRDRNSLNCTLDNLECISRIENMKRNTIHNYPEDIKKTIKLITKLKKTIHGKKQNQ